MSIKQNKVAYRNISLFICWVYLLWFCLFVPQSVLGQSDQPPTEQPALLQLTRLDISDFPTVRLQLIATDADLSPITNLNGLTLTESGKPITDFDLVRRPAGIELLVVLDANSGLSQVDIGATLTRLQIVQASLSRYAENFMDKNGLDRLHIIVPNGQDATFLLESANEQTDVVEAINGYEPTNLPDNSPLEATLHLALAQAEKSKAEGRFQAVVLYTDGGQWPTDIDIEGIVEKAQRLGLPIFVVILGSRADSSEVETVAQLFEPTNGFYSHAPRPENADPIFTAIQAHATQFQLTYRSTLKRSGDYPLVLTLGSLSTEEQLQLQFRPPEVQLVDLEGEIERVANSTEDALFSLLPQTVTLTVELNWVDGFQRGVQEAILLVNEQEVTLQMPALSLDQTLSLEWNISQLDAGNYELILQLVDEFGLPALSQPVQVTITTIYPTPTPSPLPEATPTPSFGIGGGKLFPLWGWNVLGGVALFCLAGLLFVRLRRRKTTDLLTEERLQGLQEKTVESEKVPALTPLPLPPQDGPHLEILINGLPHVTRVFLPSHNVTIGRDPHLVSLTFSDQSVSRLHARIKQTDGKFWLYDEGSATGTFLNFKRVGLMPQELRDQDTIQIGNVRLRFHNK